MAKFGSILVRNVRAGDVSTTITVRVGNHGRWQTSRRVLFEWVAQVASSGFETHPGVAW